MLTFQIEADSIDKTNAAIRTLDLDFVKKYLDQVKPDLIGSSSLSGVY